MNKSLPSKKPKRNLLYFITCGCSQDKSGDSMNSDGMMQDRQEAVVTCNKTSSDKFEQKEKCENSAKDANNTVLDKEVKDQIIKSILNKYLEMKNKEDPVPRPEPIKAFSTHEKIKPRMEETPVEVQVESSSSSELVLTGNALSTLHLSEYNVKVPFKSKSAPTTKDTRDSFVDIYNKIWETKSDTSYSGSSLGSGCEIKPKKKLELIFTRSFDEVQKNFSETSLEYKISCEGSSLVTGTLLTEVTKDEQSVNPVDRDDGDQYRSSSNTLKWKLIVSKHSSENSSLLNKTKKTS